MFNGLSSQFPRFRYLGWIFTLDRCVRDSELLLFHILAVPLRRHKHLLNSQSSRSAEKGRSGELALAATRATRRSFSFCIGTSERLSSWKADYSSRLGGAHGAPT